MTDLSRSNVENTNHWEAIVPDVDQLEDNVDEAADALTDEQFEALTDRIDGIQKRLDDNAFLLSFLTSLSIGGTARDREAIKSIAARVAKAHKALEPKRPRQWSSPSSATAHALLALADTATLLLQVAARHAPKQPRR